MELTLSFNVVYSWFGDLINGDSDSGAVVLEVVLSERGKQLMKPEEVYLCLIQWSH